MLKIGQSVVHVNTGLHGVVTAIYNGKVTFKTTKGCFTYLEKHPVVGFDFFKVSEMPFVVNTPKAPRYLQEINPGRTSTAQQFVAALLQTNAKLDLEAQNESVAQSIENHYKKLSGEDLEAPGKYRVAPDSAKKRGSEGTLYFDPAIQVPEEFGTPRQPGLLGSIAVVWFLVRIGFRLNGNHDVTRIKEFAGVV